MSIEDETDVKPEDWVDEKKIVDPDATQPDDWDEKDDGAWEAPKIDNPAYKGEWQPKRVPNPAYKGPWVHPMIDNPEYFTDDNVGTYDDFGVLAFEIWQVKSGSIFDSILLTDDFAQAEAHLQVFYNQSAAERQMKNKSEKKAQSEKSTDEPVSKETKDEL